MASDDRFQGDGSHDRRLRPSAFRHRALAVGEQRFGGCAYDDTACALRQHQRHAAHFFVRRRQRTSGEILVREVEHVVAVAGIERLHLRCAFVMEFVAQGIARRSGSLTQRKSIVGHGLDNERRKASTESVSEIRLGIGSRTKS